MLPAPTRGDLAAESLRPGRAVMTIPADSRLWRPAAPRGNAAAAHGCCSDRRHLLAEPAIWPGGGRLPMRTNTRAIA